MLKKNLNLVLFTVFTTILLSELVSYVYIENFSTPYLKAKKLLKSHSEFSWIQKSNLDTKFFDKAFQTNDFGFRDNKNEFKTLIMGPSSTVGWGVDQNESYSAFLNENLSGGVFNGGQIGYSIKQGHDVFSTYFFDKNIKVLVLAYGVNDIDYFPFEVLPASVFDISQTYFLTRNMLFQHQQLYPCPRSFEIKPRVPLADYMQTINKFYEYAQKRKIKLIIINTAHNYQGFDDPTKSKLSNIAYAEYKDALVSNDCEKARNSFFEAQKLEAYRIVNEAKLYNEALKDFSLKNNISLIDIASEMNLKKDLFVDPVHFSVKGNKLIAKKLAEVIKNL